MTPERNANGFFGGYFTGAAGNGFGLFALRDGILVGVDVGGVKFDGEYKWNSDKNEFRGKVVISAPAGSSLIQGVPIGAEGLTYELQIALPHDFVERQFIRIDTQFGPVNAKFVKLRDFG